MTETAPEFSRLLTVSRLPPNGVEESLEAKPEERAKLAKRFDLSELRLLKATLTIEPGQMETISVSGKITANITQQCVITLDPIKTHLDLAVAVTFVPATRSDDEDEFIADEDIAGKDGDIETYQGGRIDLGELVAQQIGINIDPYPRKPGAALPATEFGPEASKTASFRKTSGSSEKKDKTSD